MLEEKADLEAYVKDLNARIVQLEDSLASARSSFQEAQQEAEQAQVLAAQHGHESECRAAELRVAQDSMRSMREECNQRWVREEQSQTVLVVMVLGLCCQVTLCLPNTFVEDMHCCSC